MLPEIPPYELLRSIGQGGTATVYQARQPSLSRMVALKVLPPYFAHDEDLVARFKREATAVARLRHSHIVQVYDFGRSGDWFYLAMEFVEGGSLQERLGREGRLEMTEVLRLIEQVAQGLQHAHERRIIHRDIKPSNIMLTPDSDAVITDFGIVKMLEGSEMTKSAAAGIGTAEYMSPEQSQGETVDPRSDLYALGVVFYELLTGSLPFSGDNPMVTMHRQVYEEPVSPALVNPAVAAKTADVVLKLLAKDPEDRFATGADLAAVIAELRDDTDRRPVHLGAPGFKGTPAVSGRPGLKDKPPIVDSPTLRRNDTRLFPSPRGWAPVDDPPGGSGRRFLSVSQIIVALTALALLAMAGFVAGALVLFPPPITKDSGGVRRQAAPAARGRIVRAGADPTTREATPTFIALAVEPAAFTLKVGQTARLAAVGILSDDATGQPAVRWSVSDEALARVDSAGVVTALAPGSVEVLAITVSEGLRPLKAASELELVVPAAVQPPPRTNVKPSAPGYSNPTGSAGPGSSPPEQTDPEIPLAVN